MGIFENKYNYKCAEASYWMLYYPDHKADYERSTLEDDRLNIILSTPLAKTMVVSRGSEKIVSDVTGNKAIRLASYDRKHTEEWLRLCEDVEASLKTEFKIFLQLRRKYRNLLNKDDWKAKVEINYPSALDKAKGGDSTNLDPKTWVSSSTFRDWWNKIIRITAIEAARRDLFDI